MNIGLLSYECPPANDRAISFPNKQRYCDKHGYDFISHTENLSPSFHPAWSKVPYILKYLPYHDWLVWTDADTYVINSDIKLDSFIEEKKDMIIQTKESGSVCCGAFFIKNSASSDRLLKKWWETRFDPECTSAENKIWEELGLKKIIGHYGEKNKDKIKVLSEGLQKNPEDTDSQTFLMHGRRGHRDISQKNHLIF